MDDGIGDQSQDLQQQQQMQPPQEAELQRPQFARQMSAQQARNSPTIEQMRRLQIAQDQQQQQSGTPLAWSPQGEIRVVAPLPPSFPRSLILHRYIRRWVRLVSVVKVLNPVGVSLGVWELY